MIAPAPRRPLLKNLTGRGKLGIVAFLVTFGVLVSTTASYAYWQSNNSVTSTVNAANLTLATSNFTSVAYTFGNDSLVTTGSVTATNNTASGSTQVGTVVLTFGPDTPSTLAGLVSLTLWSTTSAANCTATATVPPGTTSALWSASKVINTTLAPGASAIYCLRSSIATRESVATSGGAMSFSPKISGTIKLGNFSGSAVATVTQSTQYIYPASTQDTTHWQWIRPTYTSANYKYCLDVQGGGSAPGTAVIAYGCSTNQAINRQFKFAESGVAGYYTIQPRNAPALRIDNNSSNSFSGITVNTAGTPATALNQQWQTQLVSKGVYQFVNAYSGLCLTAGTSTDINLGQLSQNVCGGAPQQQFLVSQAFESFGCAAASDAFSWSWTTAVTGPYQVSIAHGNTSTVVATTSATASGASVAYSVVSAYGTGTYNVTFTDSNATVVGTGTVTTTAGNSANSCTSYDFQ